MQKIRSPLLKGTAAKRGFLLVNGRGVGGCDDLHHIAESCASGTLKRLGAGANCRQGGAMAISMDGHDLGGKKRSGECTLILNTLGDRSPLARFPGHERISYKEKSGGRESGQVSRCRCGRKKEPVGGTPCVFSHRRSRNGRHFAARMISPDSFCWKESPGTSEGGNSPKSRHDPWAPGNVMLEVGNKFPAAIQEGGTGACRGGGGALVSARCSFERSKGQGQEGSG